MNNILFQVWIKLKARFNLFHTVFVTQYTAARVKLFIVEKFTFYSSKVISSELYFETDFYFYYKINIIKFFYITKMAKLSK